MGLCIGQKIPGLCKPDGPFCLTFIRLLFSLHEDRGREFCVSSTPDLDRRDEEEAQGAAAVMSQAGWAETHGARAGLFLQARLLFGVDFWRLRKQRFFYY